MFISKILIHSIHAYPRPVPSASQLQWAGHFEGRCSPPLRVKFWVKDWGKMGKIMANLGWTLIRSFKNPRNVKSQSSANFKPLQSPLELSVSSESRGIPRRRANQTWHAVRLRKFAHVQADHGLTGAPPWFFHVLPRPRDLWIRALWENYGKLNNMHHIADPCFYGLLCDTGADPSETLQNQCGPQD